MRGFVILIFSLMMFVGFVGCSASTKKEAASATNVTSNNGIQYADNMNTFNEIINGNTPVLVDFVGLCMVFQFF